MNASARLLQRGLTAVELTAVVVILGVVSAVALPRVSAMNVETRVAQLQDARGAIAAAAAITHSVVLAGQHSDQHGCFVAPGAIKGEIGPDGSGVVCIGEHDVQMRHQYPAASPQGIALAAALAEGPYELVADAGRLTVQLSSARDASRCAFSYTDAMEAGEAPILSEMETSGC